MNIRIYDLLRVSIEQIVGTFDRPHRLVCLFYKYLTRCVPILAEATYFLVYENEKK